MAVLPNEKHFTATVFIITDSSPKKALLLHHKKINKWLPPGGHIEQFENPIETAVREVREETGIDISALEKKITAISDTATLLPVPDYLREVVMPAWQDQPEHFHIDMLYVVEVPQQETHHNANESHGIRWVTVSELEELALFPSTKMTLLELLS